VTIRNLRERAGLTQRQVAELLGISRPHYTAIEVGRKQLKVDEKAAEKLCQAFEVNRELIFEKQEIYTLVG